MSYLEGTGLSVLGLCLFLGLLDYISAESYKAVVVAFDPKSNIVPPRLVNQNVQRYVTLIQDLKNKTDIVVFPENGITSLKPVTDAKSHLQPFSVKISNGEDTSNYLSNISAAAKFSEIYVVINVLEYDDSTKDMKFYSTDVVFDPYGKLIKTCRKKYLYKEQNYERGDSTQDCTFEAQFRRINRKVSFALLFDTDLVYGYEKTHDAILTSSLQSELPLSFGLSLQLGFSVRNKVNLLASAYTSPEEGYGGTGIYLRDGTSNVIINSEGFLSKDVPIDSKSSNVIDVKVTPPSKPDTLSKVMYEDLSKFSNVTGYCELQMSESNKLPYKWVTLKNNLFLGQNKTVIICALIKPEESKNQMKIVNDATVVVKGEGIGQLLPLSLSVEKDSSMVPANFHFTQEKQEDGKITVSMRLSEGKDLSVFGVAFVLNTGTLVHVSQTYFVVFLPLLVSLLSRFVI